MTALRSLMTFTDRTQLKQQSALKDANRLSERMAQMEEGDTVLRHRLVRMEEERAKILEEVKF
jgi:hypothetical protein